MIKINCSKCGNELEHLGGLAFSPPKMAGHHTKYHICLTCWKKFLNWLGIDEK